MNKELLNFISQVFGPYITPIIIFVCITLLIGISVTIFKKRK